jgi:hypothetical protein
LSIVISSTHPPPFSQNFATGSRPPAGAPEIPLPI